MWLACLGYVRMRIVVDGDLRRGVDDDVMMKRRRIDVNEKEEEQSGDDGEEEEEADLWGVEEELS